MLEPQRVHIGHVHVQPVAAPELSHVTGRTEGPERPRSAAEPLVRPDGVVAWADDRTPDPEALERAATRWFGAPARLLPGRMTHGEATSPRHRGDSA
ncbi:hypothetical protein [Streptomyces sp. M3]|uniref:aromatic-ring hydroxylase C-terminal domain-containing protein n=1 Tax=Streptomyces sp. M3 TaxID=295102 RepID=UPI00321FD54E